jgi:hypothetical protein
MADNRSRDRVQPDNPGQRMQRVRVGVTGLAAVLLIVTLATAIATGVRRSAGDTGNSFAPPPVSSTVAPPGNSIDPNSEPLAQLGAAPGGKPDKAEPPAPEKR